MYTSTFLKVKKQMNEAYIGEMGKR